jgi:hypothetical protein
MVRNEPEFAVGDPLEHNNNMRLPIAVLAFVAHTAVAAVSFPPAITPEQPVSDRVLGPAAGDQQTLAVATNGQIAFAVWLDERRGSTDLYGSRIGADGTSLDPFGILFADDATGGTVFWNGTAFVVVSERGGDKAFSFVTPDGVTAGRKSLQLAYQYEATLGSGPAARLLFTGNGVAAIVDSQANVVIQGVHTGMSPSSSVRIAGAGISEFLILYTTFLPNPPFTAVGPNRLLADRIDRDGQFLGTADTGLDRSVTGNTLALAGSPDEYLLVSRGASEHGLFEASLDRTGVKKSAGDVASADSASPSSYQPAKPAVVYDGASFFQVLWTQSDANGTAHTWWAQELAVDGVSTLPIGEVLRWTGVGYGVTAVEMSWGPLVITDAYRTGVSTSIDPVISSNSPFRNVLSSTPTLQSAPQLASSTNGYAVAWNEFGPDGSTHLYLRRFSQALSGAAIDATPIEVASNATGASITASLTAAGDTYVIAWAASTTPSGDNYVFRRLSAATAFWLDAEPVPLAQAQELVLGSNGGGVLAVYTVDRALRTRAIATSGAPLVSGENAPTDILAFQISIASNGHDYLVAWNDFVCTYPCDLLGPSHIIAMRLGADGRALDAAPLVLDGPHAFVAYPSIAWTGNNYAVSWFRSDNLAAAHVTSSGSMDASRNIFTEQTMFLSQRLVASGGDLLLLVTQQGSDSVTTSGFTVDPQSLLATGDPVLLVANQPPQATVSAAALPNGLAVAYQRIDTTVTDVGRAFVRTFGTFQRRHATR